ncbi:N-acetylmuramoyl-L-alanine amidase [Metabacillus fastidiosus]|uniref:N-acetylmuramoyl-L-alanine amidase n=1 Tax=Metabacillus fastidiosus TaxID=1458 RepID=UPI003AF31EC2
MPLDFYNRKVKTNNTYYVLKHNKLPSILIEIIIISTPAEEEMIQSADSSEGI